MPVAAITRHLEPPPSPSTTVFPCSIAAPARISTTGKSPRRSASAARASRVSFPYSPAGAAIEQGKAMVETDGGGS